jgi:tRNA (guanine37-N1)-methyltransferase
VCGRYEGVDERVLDEVDEEVSVGDFVLTGGELAALCVADAAARLVPGVLGNEASAGAESFAGEDGLLEHPHYTRPPVFRGKQVPEVLLSGDHRRIERWRRREALRVTRERRPDLLARIGLGEADQRLLDAGDDEL